MKFLFLFIIPVLFLSAKETYQQAKIDMHGGNQDDYFNNYNSIGGYKDGRLRNNEMSMSMFLDNNSSKNTNKKSAQIKK